MKMEIRRDTCLNNLISKRHNGLIKVITGVRRCGKSYMLFSDRLQQEERPMINTGGGFKKIIIPITLV